MFFCIPVQLPMQQNLNNITLEMMWTVYLDYSRHNGIAIYFISIGAWWMICLHSTISHAHKRYHLTIQNWYYSICSIVILDHIFVEFFWLAAAAVICHHWSVEKEQKKRLVDNILKSKSGVQILCRECRMRRFIWVLHIPNCKPICIFLQQSYLFNNVRIFSDIST